MRGITEGEGFANAKYRIHRDPEVLDEILEGVYFALARDPFIGQRASQVAQLYALPLLPWQPKGTKAMTLYYLVDTTTVTLVGLLFEE